MFSNLGSIFFGYSNTTNEDTSTNDAKNQDTAAESGSQAVDKEQSNTSNNNNNKLIVEGQAASSSSSSRQSAGEPQLSKATTRQTNTTNQQNKQKKSRRNKANRSIVDSTAIALEQTINAATTRFTEQLLPQSKSIEQLQSSSHQLLPTLKEQHEEDEQRRAKLEASKSNNSSLKEKNDKRLEGNDELDEDFNADSWELLDLNENNSNGAAKAPVLSASELPKPEVVEEALEVVEGSIIEKEEKHEVENAQPKSPPPTEELEIDFTDDEHEESRAKEASSGLTVQLEGEKKIEKNIKFSDDDDEEEEDDDDDDWEPKDEMGFKGMEDSWYVTPPPCFTGSRKLYKSAKAMPFVWSKCGGGQSQTDATTSDQIREDALLTGCPIQEQPAMENELIEHPSVYIASTSGQVTLTSYCSKTAPKIELKQQQEQPKKKLMSDVLKAAAVEGSSTSTTSSTSSNLPPKQKAIVLKRVSNRQVPASIKSSMSLVSYQPKPLMVYSGGKPKFSTLAKVKSYQVREEQEQKLPAIPLKASASGISIGSTSSATISNSQRKTKKAKKSHTKTPAVKAGISVLASAEQKRKKEAWENKFIVTNWASDDQDDVDDFDNLFDDQPAHKSPTPSCGSSKSQKGKGKSPKSGSKVTLVKAVQVDEDKLPMVVVSASEDSSAGGYESDISLPSTGALVMDANKEDAMSTTEIVDNMSSAKLVDENIKPLLEENKQVVGGSQVDGDSSSSAKNLDKSRSGPTASAAPTRPVRPIEPERRPGWQLKRQRSKRRPLAQVNAISGSTSDSGKSASGGRKRKARKGNNSAKLDASVVNESSSSCCNTSSDCSLSARSTPTLIERIGSIFNCSAEGLLANVCLENASRGAYANGDPSRAANGAAGSLQAHSGAGINNQQPQNGHQRVGCAQTAGAAAELAATRAQKAGIQSEALVARKRLAKRFLSRQNASSNRTASSGSRPSRRLKMHSHPNGVSVNRKVQTNFH